jgi:hypothetical protein
MHCSVLKQNTYSSSLFSFKAKISVILKPGQCYCKEFSKYLRQIFVPTIEIISYGAGHHADYRDITFHSKSTANTTMENSNNSSISASPSSPFSTDDIVPGAFRNESPQTTLTTPSYTKMNCAPTTKLVSSSSITKSFFPSFSNLTRC